MEAVYVGVDVSKQWLDVGVWPKATTFRVSNDATGVDELLGRLRQQSPAAVVLEASGGLESLVASELHTAGLLVAVVNPRQVREFARSLGTLGKLTGSTRWCWRSSPSPTTATDGWWQCT